MSFFDKTLYNRWLFIKALLWALPFSTLSLYFGIKEMTTTVDKLESFTGTVDRAFIYSKKGNSGNVYESFYIYLKEDSTRYVKHSQEAVDILNETVKSGMIITIWVDNFEEEEKTISQVSSDDDILYPFHKKSRLVVGGIFTGLGTLLLLIVIMYFKNHSQDIHGGSEEEKAILRG